MSLAGLLYFLLGLGGGIDGAGGGTEIVVKVEMAVRSMVWRPAPFSHRSRKLGAAVMDSDS